MLDLSTFLYSHGKIRRAIHLLGCSVFFNLQNTEHPNKRLALIVLLTVYFFLFNFMTCQFVLYHMMVFFSISVICKLTLIIFRHLRSTTKTIFLVWQRFRKSNLNRAMKIPLQLCQDTMDRVLVSSVLI